MVSGGADLAQAGFTGYYFDAIYICIAVQLGTILSDWFWLLFLVVSGLPRANGRLLHVNSGCMSTVHTINCDCV